MSVLAEGKRGERVRAAYSHRAFAVFCFVAAVVEVGSACSWLSSFSAGALVGVGKSAN
jgi:hypothetical protein